MAKKKKKPDIECDDPVFVDDMGPGTHRPCRRCKKCLRKRERVEALQHAISHLEHARDGILTAKHCIRSAGASEQGTIRQLDDLVRDMDKFSLSILRSWLTTERGPK